GRKVLKTKDLNNRNPKCPICDTQHDRDINAAINILNRGL
ncbi:MAG: transposase, partial [Methanobrevibacter sp.]|nr:transposase [Methanobrevibacter sp.]